MKYNLLASFLLLFHGLLFAQSPILKEVKIEFERKVNTWAGLTGSFAEEMKKSIPQYSSSFYSYETDGFESVYKFIPQKNDNKSGGFFRVTVNEDDVVYTNFKTHEQIARKNVFEKTYLLADSLKKIDWKITNDFREIAGFNCRRATAIIMDSVFVVAFYTDEILASGGPESFTGLPGMILGLVVNRLHTTWYATKVSVVDVEKKNIVAPAAPKAEKTTRSKLMESLQERFKGGGFFGRNNDQMIWGIMM